MNASPPLSCVRVRGVREWREILFFPWAASTKTSELGEWCSQPLLQPVPPLLSCLPACHWARSPTPWTRWSSSVWKGGELGTRHESWLQNLGFPWMLVVANVDKFGKCQGRRRALPGKSCTVSPQHPSLAVRTVIPAGMPTPHTSPKGDGCLQWDACLSFPNKQHQEKGRSCGKEKLLWSELCLCMLENWRI